MEGELYVAAYVDDEEERGIAYRTLRNPVPFPAFIEGWIAPRNVEMLTARRIAILVLDMPDVTPEVRAELSEAEVPRAAPSRRSKRNDPILRDLVLTLEALKGPRPPQFGTIVTYVRGLLGMQDEDAYRVRIRGTLTAESRELLRQQKIELLSFRSGLYQAFLTPRQKEWLERQAQFVESVRRYDLLDTMHTTLVAALREVRYFDAAGPPRLFDLVLHRPGHRSRALKLVRRFAGSAAIVETSDSAIRFSSKLDPRLLAVLADLPWVQSLMPVAPARLTCDVARTLIGLPAPPPPTAFRWNGEGEIVAVIDSGIDDAHPDLLGQLATEPVSFEGAPVADRVGHGTHIAGIIAGTGAAAKAGGGPPICGIAPGAKLVVVANVDAAGVPNVPLDVETLFDLAVSRGASILNVSWGRGPTKSTYDETAKSIDRYVRKHPDVLVVVAAGNYSVAPNGEYDFYTLSTPATAKNALSVGASATSRTSFAETWGQRGGSSFPTPAARDEPVSGNPDRVAGISSRGPTEFESAKPELVAPGTHILAPRARTIAPSLLWSDGTTPEYAYFGGTSMAAPVAAGAAAIVRQYLRTARGVAKPSAALLKAMLISGAARLPLHRDPTVADDIGYPDFDQGFGRLDLARILPAEENGELRHRVAFDDVADDSEDALKSATARSYALFAGEPAEPLVITLVWTDLPEKQAQNSLTLTVKRLPAGTPIVGNATFMHLRPRLQGAAQLDRRNTVHQVRIENALPGEYVLRVTAQALLAPQQGYALVAAGNLRTAAFRRLK
ncbi:MAG TPA: S8 family serine peptidase [Thermoanaerobaculia bacterium]|nr:S8 family serine peptidase [Thermoanaerobaculia bacterium]